jgi:hypothetical protein
VAEARARVAARPATFGAVGDGRSDDRAALARALQAGPVDGGGRRYGVRGALELPPGAILYDATLVQLDPAPPDVMTLLARRGGPLTLSKVTVDRGGDGRGGSQARAAQVQIVGADLALVDVAVTGSSQGTGLKLIRCTGAVVRPAVTDCTARPAGEPRDDLQDGVWVLQCQRLDLIAPRIERLLSDWGAGPRPEYSRGVTFGGGQDCAVFDYAGIDVDQHIDITGDENPRGIVVLGGHARGGRNFGVKCSNSAQGIRVLNFTAEAIARTGFTAEGSGKAFGEAKETRDIVFQGCTARAIGRDKARYGIDAPVGFKIDQSHAYPAYPQDVSFVDCVNEGGFTAYGFVNEVPRGRNRIVGCRSTGSSRREFVGW